MRKSKSPAAVSQAGPQGSDDTSGKIIHLNKYEGIDDCIVEGKEWPLVPSGIYQAIFLHHETGTAFNVPRLYLHLKIMTPGEHFGKVLYRAYRVKSTSGNQRKGAAFKVSRRSDFVREMAVLLDLDRLDRISPQILKNKILKVKVEEVTKDHKQRKIPRALRYSVVRELLSVEVGS